MAGSQEQSLLSLACLGCEAGFRVMCSNRIYPVLGTQEPESVKGRQQIHCLRENMRQGKRYVVKKEK